MTPEEAREVRRQLMAKLKPYLQAERDKMLRRGRGKPRNYREMEVYASDLLKPRSQRST